MKQESGIALHCCDNCSKTRIQFVDSAQGRTGAALKKDISIDFQGSNHV
jgi:hypothetical protein